MNRNFSVSDFYGATGAVFAHGEIGSLSATIMAGGSIDGVGAVGPISGSITATDDLLFVRSGDAITATVSSTNAPQVVQFDTSLANLSPPLPPGSTAASVQALAASAKAEVLADVAEILASFGDFHTPMTAAKTAAKTDAANSIAAQRRKGLYMGHP